LNQTATVTATTAHVRDAETGDAEALARLCTQLGYAATPSSMPARLARLGAAGGARALVATEGGEVIGLATVHLRHALNHATPLAQLSLLVVDEHVRGRGVGRALVAAAEAWAREQGCHRMIVTTALQRSDAHAFYERIGYAHTGRRYGKDFS
jgi:GNAT superfamily N-acetyltransferase